MSQTAIPLEFERYLQNQISVGDAPDMNEMIFAHIPGLDPSQPINRENGLPDVSLWVHQQDIDQVGKLGDNALAYSVVIPGSVAEFTFNAIYLRDKNVPNSCGMVVHKAEETKENGMASTKSLVQAYDGAAQIVGITVDASTWQIDYQARLKGIEEDHRLACLDNYGHTAFVDGFDVSQQADPNKYKVTPGVVYVSGLRGVLTGEVLQTITTKPNGLYVDVVRQGTALSVWENKVTIAVSETELTDYVDGNGDQHYVAKLAGINADGSVVDWRVISHDQKLMESMVGMVVPFHTAGEKRGWLDAKGGVVSRTVDKVLWNHAQDTGLVVSQAIKDADPMTHAMKFGDGDGATTFTLPNHHLGHFVRGNPAGVANGDTQGDAIRNITAQAIPTFGTASSAFLPVHNFDGAMKSYADNINTAGVSSTGGMESPAGFVFDASLMVPTASENRPYTANLSIKIHRGWM
ncbi:Phage tail protein [Vibrio crassostreae]|nr:Phage tail protein [Vibrio crassostreae]CAK2360174.1 Phage tail protein [Vibrio crassostreae]CAK2433893.1 Phage tail protein [Vibrio crassostreae]CAK3032850.1 Phage tail protein [Vibrio crassostreae]